MFRIGPRNSSVLGVMSRIAPLSSSDEQNRLQVVQVSDVVQVLPGIVQVGALEARPKSSDASTQTQTSSEVECSAEHETACNFIDRLISTEILQGDVVPVDLLCPITHHAIRIPVVAEDGCTYEKTAINRWLHRSSISPVTRQSLQDTQLYYNRNFANLTQNWARSHAKQELCRSISTTLTRV